MTKVSDKLCTIPNLITVSRLILLPILWACAFLGHADCVGIGLLIAGVTDTLDGVIARRMKLTSDLGSKLDTVADQLVLLSCAGWIYLLLPEIFTENKVLSLIALAAYLLTVLVGLVKFRRAANLHLYLSRAASLALYIFIVHAFIAGRYSRMLFMIAWAGLIISSVETLTVLLMRRPYDEKLGSVLLIFLPEDHPLRRFVIRLP
jgi:cardiolipin synthase